MPTYCVLNSGRDSVWLGLVQALFMLSQPLWVHTCIHPAVSGKCDFLEVAHHLWALQSFHPSLFHIDLWALRGEVWRRQPTQGWAPKMTFGFDPYQLDTYYSQGLWVSRLMCFFICVLFHKLECKPRNPTCSQGLEEDGNDHDNVKHQPFPTALIGFQGFGLLIV